MLRGYVLDIDPIWSIGRRSYGTICKIADPINHTAGTDHRQGQLDRRPQLFNAARKMRARSIPPLFMPHRQQVQLLTVCPPLGHILLHVGHKAIVVRAFQQVYELVYDEILETV